MTLPCPMFGYDVVCATLQSGDDIGAQINSAIISIKGLTDGGRVIIPPGVHTVETQILYDDKIWLVGRAREATVLKLKSGFVPHSLIYGSGKSDLKISDLTLDANGQEKHLLRLNACQGIAGENLGFKNAGGVAKGVYLEGATKHAQFRDLKFSDMPIGLFVISASSTLFEGLYGDNLCGKLVYLYSAEVMDCILRNVTGEGSTKDIHILEGPSRILIEGLTSKQADEQSVFVEFNSVSSSEIDIVDAEIQDASSSIPNAFAAIHVETKHTQVRVINTRTINANAKQKYGVLIDAGASECEIRGGKHEGVTAAWLNNGTDSLIDSRR